MNIGFSWRKYSCLPELLCKIYLISNVFGIISLRSWFNHWPTLFYAQSVENWCTLKMFICILKPCSIKATNKSLCILGLFLVLTRQNYMHELIKVDFVKVSMWTLIILMLLIISCMQVPATVGPVLWVKGLGWETCLNAWFDVVVKFHCKRMWLDAIFLVRNCPVIVKTIQKLVKIDCLYLLFLFLGIH